MRQVTCPVCRNYPQSIPEAQSICLCSSCGVRWTYLPEEVDTSALYSDEVYAVVDNRKSVFERIIFAEARKILAKARVFHPKAVALLDFGSGKGQFMAVAKEAGWEGLGIETATERSNFARQNYQVQVLDELYQGGVIQRGNFDFITLNHVLEHLPDPIAFVGGLLESNLAKDGLVYIEVPRADSWQAKIAGRRWMHWDIPKHLTHWTEEGMVEKFAALGYTKVASRRMSVHLGILGMLQAILSRLGYRENIIVQLKNRKTIGLVMMIGLILPFASALELLSTVFDKSGIFGIYLTKND